jgi:hypothetical protein
MHENAFEEDILKMPLRKTSNSAEGGSSHPNRTPNWYSSCRLVGILNAHVFSPSSQITFCIPNTFFGAKGHFFPVERLFFADGTSTAFPLRVDDSGVRWQWRLPILARLRQTRSLSTKMTN